MTAAADPVAGPAPVALYRDEALLVIDKPAGLLAVPGRGALKQDCLAARVQRAWPDARVVHRLDEATSGLMVFALGIEMQRRLGRAFEQREVQKRYIAVVAGRVESATGRVDLPLGADWPNRPRQQVDRAHGKPARTHWQVLSYDPGGDSTRLELTLETGRTHQLRVHLMAIGHAILGDTLYAPPSIQARSPRLLLHASALAFAHPLAGQPALAIESPPPF